MPVIVTNKAILYLKEICIKEQIYVARQRFHDGEILLFIIINFDHGSVTSLLYVVFGLILKSILKCTTPIKPNVVREACVSDMHSQT